MNDIINSIIYFWNCFWEWISCPSISIFYFFNINGEIPLKYIVYLILDIYLFSYFYKNAEPILKEFESEFKLFSIMIVILSILIFAPLIRCLALLAIFIQILLTSIQTYIKYKVPIPISSTPGIPRIKRRYSVRPHVGRIRAKTMVRDALTGHLISDRYYYVCPERNEHVYSLNTVKWISNQYGEPICPLCENHPRLILKNKIY